MFTTESNPTIEAAVQQLMPIGGAVSDLNVLIDVAAGTDAWQFVLRLNGVDTAVTCSITGTAISCASAPGVAVVFRAGDRLSIRAVGTNDPPDATMQWTAKFVSTP